MIPADARLLLAGVEKTRAQKLGSILSRSGEVKVEVRSSSAPDALRDALATPEDSSPLVLVHLGAVAKRSTRDIAATGRRLGAERDLGLVFLDGIADAGAPDALLAAGVPCVVALLATLERSLASTFATSFYHALSEGATVREAFDYAARVTSDEAGLALDAPESDTPWRLHLPDKNQEAAEWRLPGAQPAFASANGGDTSPPESFDGPEAAGPDGTEPVRLERYPSLECPERTPLGVPFSLFIELLREPPSPEAEAVVIEDTGVPERLPEVEVVVRAPDFELEGSNTRLVQVARDDDAELRFKLTPRTLGEGRIRVDFYQHGRRIGTVRCSVEVTEEAGLVAPTPARAHGTIELVGAPVAPPPDLELTVMLDPNDDHTLIFTLHSTDERVGYHHTPAGTVRLLDSPLAKVQAMADELGQLARRDASREIDLPATPPVDPKLAERRLAALGNDLWDELIPDALKREYWRFRGRAHSLLITSDEPWIPWEMVKPYRSEDGEREEDDCWCQTFALSRWLSRTSPAGRLSLGAARSVAPVPVDLPAVAEEIAFVERLGELRSGVRSLATLSDRLELLDWLERGEVSLVHFACHGSFDATLPNDSAILLTGGPLRPSDIRLAFGGRRPRPLVFINACHGARLDRSFTGLGGWADRFVDVGAGAFIGALWAVDDTLAFEFARRFYTELFTGDAPIGEAFRRAREELRRLAPDNSTWLAYVLYADPEGRVTVPDAA